MPQNSHRQAPLMREGGTIGCDARFWLHFGTVLRFLEKIFIRTCDAQFLGKIWLKFSAVFGKITGGFAIFSDIFSGFAFGVFLNFYCKK